MKEKVNVTGAETMVQTLYARAKETKKAKMPKSRMRDCSRTCGEAGLNFSKDKDKAMNYGVIARTINRPDG